VSKVLGFHSFLQKDLPKAEKEEEEGEEGKQKKFSKHIHTFKASEIIAA
jgi:hypothetical protein